MVSWFLPFYNDRKIQYEKHLFVLDHACQLGQSHPRIQQNELGHEGISTNCSRARSYLETPVFLGALGDFWTASPFHTLLHASTWQLQVAYIGIALFAIYLLVHEIFRFMTNSHALDALQQKPIVNGRRRMLVADRSTELVKVGNSSSNELRNLADSLITEKEKATSSLPNTNWSSTLSQSRPSTFLNTNSSQCRFNSHELTHVNTPAALT